MDLLNLFDEIDGRLTRATIHCGDLGPKIWSIQKHVRFALNHSEQVDWQQAGKDTLGKVSALMAIHHELVDDLLPVSEKLRDAISG